MDTVVAFTGGNGGTTNTGRMFMALKPLSERKLSVDRGHRAAAPEAGHRARRQPVPAAGAGHPHRRPPEQRAYQFTLQGDDLQRAESLGAARAARAAEAAGSGRRQQRPAEPRASRPSLVIDRDTASRLGIYAADDRRHALRRLRPAPGVDHVHAAEPVPRGDGGGAALLAEPRDAARHLRALVDRRAGAAERLRALRAVDHALWRSITRGSSPPSRCPSTSRPASRWATRSSAIDGGGAARSACPPRIRASFQGTAQAFQASLANEPMLILAALVTVYIVLGMLYESYIHPLTILSTLPSAGVGRDPGAAALPHRPERHRADRHHPADRHRQEERHHDDRLRAGRRAPRRQVAARRRSTRPACCASGRS